MMKFKLLCFLTSFCFYSGLVFGYIDTPNPCTGCLEGNKNTEFYEHRIEHLDSIFELGAIKQYDYLIEKGKLFACMASSNPASNYFYLAKTMFLKSLEVQAENAISYNKLAALYILYQDPPPNYQDTAKAYIEVALKLKSRNGETYRIAADLDFFDGKYKRAIRYLRKAKELGVCNQNELTLMLIANYFCNGRLETAFDLYEQHEATVDPNYEFPNFMAVHLLPRKTSLPKKFRRFLAKIPEDSKYQRYRYILEKYEAFQNMKER